MLESLPDRPDHQNATTTPETWPLLPDPGFLWQVFRRNLRVFILTILLVLGLTGLYLMFKTPIYQAEASLLIKPSGEPVRTSEPADGQPIINADQIDTEIRLIESPVVAQIAARLYANRFASPDGDPFTSEEIDGLASQIRYSVKALRSGQTSVVDLIGTSADPAFAASAANLVGEAYLQSQVNVKTGDSETSEAFLDARMAELEHNALTTQSALDNYKADHGLVSGNGGTNAEQEVSNINQQLAVAKADLAESRGRLAAAQAQLAKGGGGADVGAALGSGTIASLRQQEAKSSAEVAMLRQTYGPMHPERQKKEKELADIRQRIQEEIGRVLSNLQAEVQTAQSRVSSLESSRGQALGALTSTGRAQTKLNELQQKADAAQSIYESFLRRSQETAALRNSALPDASLATRATVPTRPSSPNVPLTVIVGLFASIFAGLLAILLSEYLRRGIQTKRDVERQLRLRYAGSIPSLKSTLGKKRLEEEPQEYVINHPQSLFAEAFRSVRTFMTLSPGKRPRVIAITSALPREGKTTTSVCLARTTASEGVRTILVDGDLRRRGASEITGYECENDIYDVLSGTSPLEDCIHVDTETGLHILGSNAMQAGKPSPSNEERLESLFDTLREHYDVIIVDTAPILGVAESRVWARLADRVLMISQWKKTSVRAVEAVSNLLIDSGAKIAGLALTQVDIRKYASTGDGDVYAYTKKFKGYYSD